MAHWYHRNPLKATGRQDFHFKMVAHDPEAIKICSDLKQSRTRLLDLLPDPHHTPDQMSTAVKLYLSVLRGLVESQEDSGASKLRHALKFKWSHSMLNEAELQQDAAFEAASMVMNVAFWHMKHASMIAGKDAELALDEAKDIHSSLRVAAGMIKFVQECLVPQLVERPKEGSDLDMRLMTAYLNQCTAEAQEVTIARAVELKHNPGLISALANETSKMYTTAADSLQPLQHKIFGHWRAYLLLKAKFYLAYAYNYMGEHVLAQDKCGEGIRSLQESKKAYNEAVLLAREYAKTKGPGTKAKPEQHPFFRRLLPIVDRTLAKCERENGFIYHQKVPYDAPDLEIKDKTFGLVSPESFELPAKSPLWTPVAYAAMDISENATEDKSKKNKKKNEEKEDEELKPVKEVETKQSDKQPKNDSGCVIS